jgi:hypothetical protein
MLLGAASQARIAWIDGITEAMTLHGMDPLSNGDIARFAALLTAPLTRAGLAAVSLDHVTKYAAGSGRYSLGGVHKLNAITGAQYLLENREPFGIGRTGRTSIRIAKDRPGQLRRHALQGRDNLAWFGDLVITSHDETSAGAAIDPPRENVPSDGAVELFDPARVSARRYYYRGTKIATPWPSTA